MSEFESQVLERLVRMETKLDHVKEKVDSHETRLVLLEKNHPHPDHESRIRRLERAIYIAAGTAAASGGAIGTMINFLAGV